MPNYLDQLHGVSLSEAYAEAAASAPAHRVMLPTYQLDHPSFDAPIYIVNDHRDFQATLETSVEVTFIACPVDVVGAAEDDTGRSPTIEVRIDGVSPLIVRQLDLAAGTLNKITITERLYASDDPSGPAVLPPLVLTLREVEVTETTVVARAGFSDPVNRGFPAKDYISREYPGLGAR